MPLNPARFLPSFGVKPRASASQSQHDRPMLGGKGVIGGKDKNGIGGKGLGKAGAKRHR